MCGEFTSLHLVQYFAFFPFQVVYIVLVLVDQEIEFHDAFSEMPVGEDRIVVLYPLGEVPGGELLSFIFLFHVSCAVHRKEFFGRCRAWR